MISAVIVYGSLLLALLFTLAYLVSPGLRARVEQPKYSFQKQLAAYDRTSTSITDLKNDNQNERENPA